MSKFGEDLVQGFKEAVAFARGNKAGARVHVVEVPDVRAIRRLLHMSQHEFAEAFRIPLATLKNWEQGRRVPDAPAAAYLQAIARRPQVIREALQHG
jgi:putative transcriptional regulator